MKEISKEIQDYINEAAPPEALPFVVSYVEECVNMGADLQLDKPLIRVRTSSGGQVATVDVTTGETRIIQS